MAQNSNYCSRRHCLAWRLDRLPLMFVVCCCCYHYDYPAIKLNQKQNPNPCERASEDQRAHLSVLTRAQVHNQWILGG
eukprot:9482192-Pyramimonas_sp.AAC.4